MIPYSLPTRAKQSIIPLYLGISPDLIRGLESYVYNSSFTRSIGATTVLEMAPEIPPAAKSLKNAIALSPELFSSFALATIIPYDCIYLLVGEKDA